MIALVNIVIIMPRVRRNPNYRQLSEFERGRIVESREAGPSYWDIVILLLKCKAVYILW